MTIALNLPSHLYGVVDRRFLSGGEQEGWEPAVLFGLSVPANRAVGLSVLLECGALYRELPPHAWAFSEDAASEWTLEQAEKWNCFGGDAQALAYDYLSELWVYVPELRLDGTYLFSLEFASNGFSRYPAQSKTLHGIQLSNGRLTLRPGNEILWHEGSFTEADGPPTWLRRQTEVWSVEEGRPWWAGEGEKAA